MHVLMFGMLQAPFAPWNKSRSGRGCASFTLTNTLVLLHQTSMGVPVGKQCCQNDHAQAWLIHRFVLLDWLHSPQWKPLSKSPGPSLGWSSWTDSVQLVFEAAWLINGWQASQILSFENVKSASLRARSDQNEKMSLARSGNIRYPRGCSALHASLSTSLTFLFQVSCKNPRNELLRSASVCFLYKWGRVPEDRASAVLGTACGCHVPAATWHIWTKRWILCTKPTGGPCPLTHTKQISYMQSCQEQTCCSASPPFALTSPSMIDLCVVRFARILSFSHLTRKPKAKLALGHWSSAELTSPSCDPGSVADNTSETQHKFTIMSRWLRSGSARMRISLLSRVNRAAFSPKSTQNYHLWKKNTGQTIPWEMNTGSFISVCFFCRKCSKNDSCDEQNYTLGTNSAL